MKFSAVSVAALTAIASAQKFSLVAIRSGSDIQNSAISSDGQKLVIGGGEPTTYEVIGQSLYANGKPVQFGNGATIQETDGQATKDIIVNGQDYLYVPNFDFTACAAQGREYSYTVTSSEDCQQGATPFAARVVYLDGAAAADNATVTAAAAGNATVVTETGVITANKTIQVTITSCSGTAGCHPKATETPAVIVPVPVVPHNGTSNGTQAKPEPSQAEATGTHPVLANGASVLGFSGAIAAVAAGALFL